MFLSHLVIFNRSRFWGRWRAPNSPEAADRSIANDLWILKGEPVGTVAISLSPPLYPVSKDLGSSGIGRAEQIDTHILADTHPGIHPFERSTATNQSQKSKTDANPHGVKLCSYII